MHAARLRRQRTRLDDRQTVGRRHGGRTAGRLNLDQRIRVEILAGVDELHRLETGLVDIIGSTTPSASEIAAAASTALPPERSVSSPACVASGWLAPTAPLRPMISVRRQRSGRYIVRLPSGIGAEALRVARLPLETRAMSEMRAEEVGHRGEDAPPVIRPDEAVPGVVEGQVSDRLLPCA